MPTYDYVCQTCNYEFEEMQKISASPLTFCPECENDTLKRKVGGGIGLNFLGSGFYCTDYGSCPCGKKES